MRRHCLLLLAVLGLALLPAFGRADVGPPIRIRWSGDWPAPARAGLETIGRFEIAVERAGVVDDLAVGGEGWTLNGLDASGRLFLPPGTQRVVTFRAVPTIPTEPLVVTGTVNGIPFRKAFRLDAERLSRIGRRGTVRAMAEPVLSGTESGPRTSGVAQTIRFRGRFMYDRQGTMVGGDNVVVRIMDDDSPFGEEEIGRFLTDSEGNFDQTLTWDDCDLTGCDDPDIFVIYELANLVVEVRSDDTEEMYTWNTGVIEDFTGTEIDFGIHTPDANHTAVHIYNGIVRSHRYAVQNGEMDAAHTFCHWPSTATTGAFYNNDFNQIHMGSGEEWNEGTAIHEYGHRLGAQFSVLDPPNYLNGFCDTPTPGHCVWCPENLKDGWQEGFANWYGSVVMRHWIVNYDDTPLSLNDNRYDLETPLSCGDGTFYANGTTEGYVGALLRDIEDFENDNHDNVLPDCDMDVLGLGSPPILRIFRDDDPETVNDFITAFRALHGALDPDLWATIENVAPAMNFAQPAPQVVAQPPACRVVRQGDDVTLQVAGDGTLYRYRWRRNGELLGDPPGFSGSFTPTLLIENVQPNMAGDYDCVISTCDGSQSVTTTITRIRFDGPIAPGPLVSWGENWSAQVGSGAAVGLTGAHAHTLTDIVQADGGRVFSMALRRDGAVYTWGEAQYGEFGNGIWTGQITTPTPITIEPTMRITAGKSFALALGRDGIVRGWGWNAYGQLFTGDRDHRNRPDTALIVGCVKDIAAGENHSLALLEDGTVWSVGLNDYGSLGTGSFGGTHTQPQQVVGLTDVIAISAAGYWSMALTADSTVWTWGINTAGQLGLGHHNAVAVPTQVSGLTGIKQISAGFSNGYALRSDGRAWAWGYGPAIGIGWTGGSSNIPQQVPLDNITKIEGGADWAMALIGGRLKAWGLNAAVGSTTVGVFNTTGPYVQGSPIDVPEVHSISDFGTGWGTAHAFGLLGLVNVPGTEVAAPPSALALAASPNPMPASGSIHFDLPAAGSISLAVYDVAGRRVRTLAAGSFEPGRYQRTWDGTTDDGARVGAGVYLVRLSAPEGSRTRTIVRLE